MGSVDENIRIAVWRKLKYQDPEQEADHDAICLWRTDDKTECYAPVQLKELPPSNANPHATLKEHLRSEAGGGPPRADGSNATEHRSAIPISDDMMRTRL